VSPNDLSRALHRRSLSDRFLLGGLCLLLFGLLGLAVVQGANAHSDRGQGASITEIRDEIIELCSSGAIDCTGTSDLPPPKDGASGTGIRSVTCTPQGKFRFVFTTGRVSLVGKCLAKDGARGPEGRPGIAIRGPRGETGFVSEDQVRRVAASVLAGYCAAHNQCKGPKGDTGKQGRQGPKGPKGDKGDPGNDHGGGHGPGLDEDEIHRLLCLVVPCRQ